MHDRILKLAKRLNKFTLKGIEPILCCKNLEDILAELIAEESLKLSNGIYFYIKKAVPKKELPNFFQYHTQDEIDMIIKCFCADIPALKTTLLVESSKTVVSNFYKYFRAKIYKKQLMKLKECFKNKPKIPAIRAIYDKKVYLYYYDDKVFVSDKLLKTKENSTLHGKSEMREIRNSYYKVRRYFMNYSLQKVLPEVIAERLWKQDKNFEELVFELKQLLF